jgi:hypothetical protein
MRTTNRCNVQAVGQQRSLALQRFTLIVALSVALSAVPAARGVGPGSGKVYAAPEAAITDLEAATSRADTNALKAIFGPTSEALLNVDRVQATNDLEAFNSALVATNHFVRVSDKKLVLEVGEDLWPFPVPLVKATGGWRFDTEAGREEIINRRVGRNELGVLAAMRAYVDAQREYASEDRDGDQVLEYAQKLASSPGLTDGLYWPVELNGEMSPLGPLVADARTEGYLHNTSDSAGPQPFHGYYFRILTRQGKHAPGGEYDYIINGNMIGGFALVAWPADYGQTGVMTFVVNQQGRVYQKDLGPNTEKTAKAMKTYDPDRTWSLSSD